MSKLREQVKKKFDKYRETWGITNNYGIEALRLQFYEFWNYVDERIKEHDAKEV